jgi:hypothetical protein
MSDYIKGTNFAAKDVLPSGDPSKIIRGTEIDNEFNAIAGAVSSKRDSTSTVPIANGGTGQTTANAAINALLPSQTGNNGRYLTTNGTNTSWATVVGGVTSVTASTPLASSGGATPNISLTGTVALGNGGTGSTTAAGARTNLGLGSLATLNSASLTSNVTGTLPIGNGGTNLTTYTTGDIIYASASNTLAKRAIGTTGQVLTVSGGVPTWATPTASGDTTGAASSVDNGVVLFSGTGGKTLKSSAAQDGFVYGVRVGRGAGGVSTNTALGAGALNANTTGSFNVGIGYNAGDGLTTDSESVAIGANTMGGNSGVSVAVGTNALGSSSLSGGAHVAVGYGALGAVTTPSSNTGVGYGAGQNITTGGVNVCLGALAGTSSSPFNITTESFRVVVGASTITNAYIQVAWTVVSDGRDKEDVADAPYGLDFVNRLRPVQYKWDKRSSYYETKPDGTVIKHEKDGSKKEDKLQLGFIAQDIIALEKEFGAVSPLIGDEEQADSLKVTETKLIPVLVKAIQELKAELDSVKAELAALKAN